MGKTNGRGAMMENKEHIESVYERMRLERKDPEAARVIHDLYHQLQDKESKLAAMESHAAKLITQACCNAVEKLNEIAPDKGWDSGEVVAEMYIRQLSIKPVPADKQAVDVMPEVMPESVHNAINWQLGPNHRIASTAKGIYDAVRSALSASPSHSQQSARITEQDAIDIGLSAFNGFDKYADIDTWLECEGQELLEKLNADRCPSHDSEQGGES